VSVGRFLLHFFVVLVAIVLAGTAGTLVTFIANWNGFVSMLGADPTASEGALVAVASLLLLLLVSVATFWLLMPGLIGVLLSEAFSIRSWLFHTVNGALSIWVGRRAVGEFQRTGFDEDPLVVLAAGFQLYDTPLIILAAGLAAGFVYWAIAGRNAGVMEPTRAAPIPR
jgi:hypothetical protein